MSVHGSAVVHLALESKLKHYVFESELKICVGKTVAIRHFIGTKHPNENVSQRVTMFFFFLVLYISRDFRISDIYCTTLGSAL